MPPLALALSLLFAVPQDGPDPLWFRGPYFSARGKAQAEGKLLLVVFVAEWSDWSRRLETETFVNTDVRAALGELVCLRVDGDGPAAKKLGERFPVRTYPCMFFVGREDEPEDLIAGYIAPQPFLVELRRIQAGDRTRSDLLERAAAAPDDIEAHLVLATKLEELGDVQGTERALATVRRLDPEGRSEPVRGRELVGVREEMVRRFDDSKGLYDTAPLVDFLATERHGSLLFQGWSYLADLYLKIDRPEAAREAHRHAWESVPPGQIAPYGNLLASTFFAMRGELTRSEREFALDVARRATEALAPDTDPATHAAYLETLACCQLMNGDRDDALATIERALVLAPDRETLAVRREALRAGR